jgi:hypothetical protein
MANTFELRPLTNLRDASQDAGESGSLIGRDDFSLNSQSIDSSDPKQWGAFAPDGATVKRGSARRWAICIVAALGFGIISMLAGWLAGVAPVDSASEPVQIQGEHEHDDVHHTTKPPGHTLDTWKFAPPSCCDDQSCADLDSLSPSCIQLVDNPHVVANGGCSIQMSLLGQAAGSGLLGDSVWCPISCNVCAGTDDGEVTTITADTSAGTVAATVALDHDISSIPAGTAERKQFEDKFKSDVGAALGVNTDRVRCPLPPEQFCCQCKTVQLF